ncbi:MAG TPA: hypothetical protein VE398_21145 [Acidobacteriota bacterium]|nr:hypothetical protein [Acidobacteriota bacterium]
MTFDQFKDLVAYSQKPGPDLPPLLQALLCDARGDWDGGHRIAQDIESKSAAWVHAYLHRKEGDLGNAGYWYKRAGRPESRSSLAEEWDEIARHLLQD